MLRLDKPGAVWLSIDTAGQDDGGRARGAIAQPLGLLALRTDRPVRSAPTAGPSPLV